LRYATGRTLKSKGENMPDTEVISRRGRPPKTPDNRVRNGQPLIVKFPQSTLRQLREVAQAAGVPMTVYCREQVTLALAGEKALKPRRKKFGNAN
jgi:hypothetical protein